MLSGALRGGSCFFRVISSSRPFSGVVTQALLPGNCGWGWTGSGQRTRIKAIWLPPAFSSYAHLLFLCLGFISCPTSLAPISSVSLYTDVLQQLSLKWSHRSTEDTLLVTISPPLPNRSNRKLPWNKTNKRNDGWSEDLDRFHHHQIVPCHLQSRKHVTEPCHGSFSRKSTGSPLLEPCESHPRRGSPRTRH